MPRRFDHFYGALVGEIDQFEHASHGVKDCPGHITPGGVQGLSHVVDMYPTLAAIAGAKMEKNKPLDRMKLWPAIREGGKTRREEAVYTVDPTGGAVQVDDKKFVDMAPGLLIMDAIKLTFGAPPVAADRCAMLKQLGD